MRHLALTMITLGVGMFVFPRIASAQGGDICGHCLEDPWPSPGGHAIVSSTPALYTHEPQHGWVTGISCNDHDDPCEPILAPTPGTTPQDQVNLLAMAHNAFLLEDAELSTLRRDLGAQIEWASQMFSFQPCKNGPTISVPFKVRPQ